MRRSNERAAAVLRKDSGECLPDLRLGGIVWTYMGPKDKQPPLPNFAWTRLPETHREVSKVVQACNWLQALEGGIDTSHFTIMHRALRKNSRQPGIEIDSPGVRGGAPTLEVDVTDYGYAYFGIRPMGDGSHYVRGYHFIMPFTQLRPPGPDKNQTHGHYWVPIDDETCMVWNFYSSYEQEPLGPRSSESGNGYGTHIDVENGFRPVRNQANDWMIDRQMQKTETFTGIDGINQQDRAVQESMGHIVDRTRENLGPADRAVVATRRLLLEAVDTVQRNGGSARDRIELLRVARRRGRPARGRRLAGRAASQNVSADRARRRSRPISARAEGLGGGRAARRQQNLAPAIRLMRPCGMAATPRSSAPWRK